MLTVLELITGAERRCAMLCVMQHYCLVVTSYHMSASHVDVATVLFIHFWPSPSVVFKTDLQIVIVFNYVFV